MSQDRIATKKSPPCQQPETNFLFHFFGQILTVFAPVSQLLVLWKTLPPSTELTALAGEKTAHFDETIFKAIFYCSICHHQQGRIDFNTVNPSLSTGKDFLIHSL